MEKIGEAMQGGAPIFEWMHRNAQGQDIPCEVRLVRIPGAHPRVRASVTDITERKRIEEETRHLTDLQSAILNNAGAAIIATTTEGIVTLFNPNAERLLGYTAEEMIGKLTAGVFHNPDEVVARARSFSKELGITIEPGFEVFVAKARLNLPNEHEWTYIRKDSTSFPVLLNVTALRDANGEINGFLGVATDITEHKKAEAALIEGEARLRTLIENAPEAIVVVDLSTGLFTEPNENAVKLYGLSREELTKVGPAQMSPPTQPDGRDSTEKAMEKIGEAMQGGTPVFEWIHRNAHGKDIPCEVRLVRLPGEQPLVRASVTDITRRKHDEELTIVRAKQLETVAAIATASSTLLEPERLLQTVTNLTKERFDLYHAHIYLMDESMTALVLASGAGQIGMKMVSQGYSIPASKERSLVARAAREKQAVIVNDVHGEPDFLPNPLLPETRAEMAVPLIVGDRVLGVLDVQSNRVDYFTQEDVNIQTTLAAQIAIALQNARTLSQAQRQAERESMLNTIGQKIQNATTVEAVLQIAARELGRALDAPLTIAQLGMGTKFSNNGNGNGNGH
jgi:PAS domain S-box-containing protein